MHFDETIEEMVMNIDRLKELIDYNPESGAFVWLKDRGYVVKAGDDAGSVITFPHNNKSYLHIRIDGILYKAHRLAWIYCNGAIGDDDQIDHINGDSLDNRICNLRIVSGQENSMNKRQYKNNKSGHTGINKLGNRWRATIAHKNKKIHIGVFDTVEQAVKARKDKQVELGFSDNHGEPV